MCPKDCLRNSTLELDKAHRISRVIPGTAALTLMSPAIAAILIGDIQTADGINGFNPLSIAILLLGSSSHSNSNPFNNRSLQFRKMRVVWDRLIRFVAADGRILRGEPILPTPDFDLGTATEETKLQAKIITGSDPYDTSGKTKVSDELVTVKRLLGPLAQEDVDILRCVGLNYAKHSMYSGGAPDLISDRGLVFLKQRIHTNIANKTVKEAGRTPPPFPFIFFKPTTCILDHGEDVEVPKIAQDDQADYEGELVSLQPYLT